MGQKRLVPQTKGSCVDFQTPPGAITPLIPYLDPGWTIWECAAGKGNLVRALESHGFKVVDSDIRDGLDFLRWRPDTRWDCIITNPPYDTKDEFLARCYKLGKPFAMLMPLTTLEGQKRQPLFKKHGVQVIMFDKRINFETPSGKGGGSWIMTAWFTWGLGLESDLTFVKYLPAGQTTLP